MKAEELDKLFDEGKEDIIEYLDLNSAKRVNQKQHKVNIDFPEWMLKQLEKEAQRVGVSKQAIIKIWLSERLAQTQKI